MFVNVTRPLEEGFHTLIEGDLFSSLTNVGDHNPTPFGAQRPRWHSFLYPLEEGFHTLIKGDLFSSLTNVGDHFPYPYKG